MESQNILPFDFSNLKIIHAETNEIIDLPSSFVEPYESGEENPLDPTFLLSCVSGFIKSKERQGTYTFQTPQGTMFTFDGETGDILESRVLIT